MPGIIGTEDGLKIGITYDLKEAATLDAGAPDDAHEEFDSPHTIDALARALAGLGHSVVRLGDGREFLEKVLAERPDFVFNFAEGHGISRSREARVPAVLEMLGIPFTGSDPFTMAVTLDKACAKKLVSLAGVAVPRGFALEAQAPVEIVPVELLPLPLVVKPAWEGSSKGIRSKCLVKKRDDLADVVLGLRRDHPQTVLLEEYIDGVEVTVGLYGNDPPQVLGVMSVAPNEPAEQFIYSLEIKREYKRLVTYECPAKLPADVLKAVETSAKTVFHELGCRDVARIDFRVRNGIPYFLEVNPLPGLNPEDSDLVIMSRLVGWSYDRLVGTIVEAALRRQQLT
jgi:D-alanine-D-alanine ligase